MPHLRRTSPLCLAALLGLPACVPALTVPDDADPEALSTEETRSVELRFLRLDAKGFAQTLTKADIKERFPERVLRETWLLDMPLEPLITNALEALVRTPAEEAYTLETPALNMWKLLNMTPDNTVLDGTSLAPLLGVGKAVGLAPSLILGDLIGIDANAPVITVKMTTPAVIDHVVSTHPNAQKRRGPVTPDHPDGLYDVTAGSMPVSLWDVVTDFQDLRQNFGPVGDHPGFIADASPIAAATDDFEMTVRVNLNALPYKGVDLTNAHVASVNSTSSQLDDAFDFSTPDWMEIKGLVDALVIDEMTMAIYENPVWIASGTAVEPAPLGDSSVWELPGWQFERLIAEVAVKKAAEIAPHCTVYSPQGDVDDPLKAVQVCMGDDGVPDNNDAPGVEPDDWVSIAIDESVVIDEADRPKPSYFWDVLLEVAQVRLHDGAIGDDSDIPEGDADIQFTLRDIAVGITTQELEQKIRENIQNTPSALAAIAELLNENTDGDADFYYYVPNVDNPEDIRGDWLYFIAEDDLKEDADGENLRPYNYARPGFFRDRALTDKASSTVEIDHDRLHEKVKIEPGDELYIEDDQGSVFKITVKDKPERHRIVLDITRVD
jgi:hypothetical protein